MSLFLNCTLKIISIFIENLKHLKINAQSISKCFKFPTNRNYFQILQKFTWTIFWRYYKSSTEMCNGNKKFGLFSCRDKILQQIKCARFLSSFPKVILNVFGIYYTMHLHTKVHTPAVYFIVICIYYYCVLKSCPYLLYSLPESCHFSSASRTPSSPGGWRRNALDALVVYIYWLCRLLFL